MQKMAAILVYQEMVASMAISAKCIKILTLLLVCTEASEMLLYYKVNRPTCGSVAWFQSLQHVSASIMVHQDGGTCISIRTYTELMTSLQQVDMYICTHTEHLAHIANKKTHELPLA